MSTEEQALRSALSDAVAGQPAAPYDRIDGVRRRHAHRRQRQLAAIATAAIVAVTGATFGILSARGDNGDVQLAKRDVPSWALSWPDARDPSIPQPVLDGAVDAWSHAAGIETATTALAQHVYWYRAAKVAHGAEIAVMFEVVSAEYGNQLVVGYADTDQVSNGQPGYDVAQSETPWILSVVTAPVPTEHLVFGINVHDSQPPATDTFGDNVIVVMADPRSRSVEWHVTGVDGQVRRAVSALSAGFAEVDTGQIRERVRIDAVRDDHGTVLAHDVGVGVPGAPDSYHAQLAEVPPFTDVPDSNDAFGVTAGQGNSGYESQLDNWPMHGTTVYARCYGGAHIVVAIDADKPGHRVVIPCDDREHIIDGPPVLAHSELASEGMEDSNGNFVPNPPGNKNHAIQIQASDDTAWRVAVTVR
ncbi:MAG: hypothetical protein QOC82_261 [Frankiaceae bacterium]|nr:hypothetical protein [Frankiaceae bacterium]